MFSRLWFSCIVILFTSFQIYGGDSRIELVTIDSPALGTQKSFNIYLPEGYDESDEKYPSLYLFRGNESEWVNPRQGNIKNIIDQQINWGRMGKMILVMPGLTFAGETILGFPVNMMATDIIGDRVGLGTGQFEDYLIQDLIPYVDSNYRTIVDRASRGTDGFSAGAYSAIMIAIKHPELFISAGCYDGPFGWTNFDDPRTPGSSDDSLWMNVSNFDPFFGIPRDIDYMKLYNPANMIAVARQDHLDMIKSIQFLIHAASENANRAWFEGSFYERTKSVVENLASKGITNYFDEIRLTRSADHTWAMAQGHILSTLPLHWQKFEKSITSVNDGAENSPNHFTLLQNYPNPFNPETTIQYQVAKRSEVKLIIFSLLGQHVATLVDEVQSMGVHSIQWNGKDDTGKAVASGVYLYRLQTEQFVQVKKLALLR